MANALMFQGTGSDVGKSIIVAGLCRVAKRRGISVAPFKPQNMSNNAAACVDGGEIGRAQALQAFAAGLQPHTDFNPVLLKPQSDTSAQVIVHGKPLEIVEASKYINTRDKLMGAVVTSFERLSTSYDLIIVEGAGSPAEINLRARDIANMGFARKLGVPVCLIGDIDKGGVIASLVGTKNVISPNDADMITSFIVNKFRGNPSLFDEGVKAIENITDWPCLGVIPWIGALARLPAEDSVLQSRHDHQDRSRLKISAPMLSRMANFDDADPLRLDPNVDFQWIPPGQVIPRETDVIILFGTKSTLGELDFIRMQEWDKDILSHARHGGHVLGVCGGYQMLGKTVTDSFGNDGIKGTRNGLGLLNVETLMNEQKIVRKVHGKCLENNVNFDGYEIHSGRTFGLDCNRPVIEINDSMDGAKNANLNVAGTYVHGIFSSNEYRDAWIQTHLKRSITGYDYGASIESALDELADTLEKVLNIDALLKLAKPIGWYPH